MITIDNCTALDVKGFLLNIRGDTLFQTKLSDIFMIRYTISEHTLDLHYTQDLAVKIRLAPTFANIIPLEYIQNLFPQYFFRFHSQSQMQFFNFKLLSFIQMTRNSIVFLFNNAIPVTVTIDEANIVNIYSQCTALHEVLSN